ncbi:class I SAM-dependent methyltransferase [Kutzneria buriramensis]|uniref:Methyltransferase family protein n=1 Tax=Kutzneria buriramensis TaxID=1045776 RepID=A0A3E0ICP9_9PSEU|nr:class I SAM-dependent methyltransferase [Kutzneria buriramensis]REH55955.1 methyltransferase family protein [Kutzneria buriramensis]
MLLGNAAEVTVRNAELEGVADRIELTTGDLRALPFEADDFDLVVSSLAIHNIKSPTQRERRSTRRCGCSGRSSPTSARPRNTAGG